MLNTKITANKNTAGMTASKQVCVAEVKGIRSGGRPNEYFTSAVASCVHPDGANNADRTTHWVVVG